MKVLILEQKSQKLKIDILKGQIIGLQGNDRDLCEGNTYSLFNVSVIGEKYEKKRISTYDCVFECMEENDTGYEIKYLYKDDFVFTVYVANNPAKDAFCLRLRIKNSTADLIEWVEFPAFSVENYLDGSKQSAMLWMFNEGVLVHCDKQNTWPYEEPHYPDRGITGLFPNMVESQFMAYLFNDGGLYIGCHDEKCGVKQIDFYHQDERIKIQLRLYSNACYGEDFSMDYDIVLRFFKGEWQDACDIYRAWYESVSTVSKIENTVELPAWYQESPLVVALPIRGAHDQAEMSPTRFYPYDNLLKEVERIANQTKSKLLVHLMHWEGSAPWAPPYVWPPYGGEQAFKAFSDKLHAMGHYLGVYCSGFSWTQQSRLIPEYNREEEFEKNNLQEEMSVSIEQVLEYTNICDSQRSGYHFCATSKYLREVIQKETDAMFNAGIDFVQLLDQNHGGCTYFCYSKTHGHPHAPGVWQVDEVNHILTDLLTGERVFGCESAAAEPFIGNLRFNDNRWTYAELAGEAVPAYAYIYHSRVNNFMGNQSCCPFRLMECDYLYRLTYSFLAGDMLTIVLDDDGDIMHFWGAAKTMSEKPEQESCFKLIENMNAWRVVAKEYLCYGDMVKTSLYECDEFMDFIVQRRLGDCVKRVEKVLSNAFSHNNKKAEFFVNYTKQPVKIKLPIQDNEKCFMSVEEYIHRESSIREKDEIIIEPLSIMMREINE